MLPGLDGGTKVTKFTVLHVLGVQTGHSFPPSRSSAVFGSVSLEYKITEFAVYLYFSNAVSVCAYRQY